MAEGCSRSCEVLWVRSKSRRHHEQSSWETATCPACTAGPYTNEVPAPGYDAAAAEAAYAAAKQGIEAASGTEACAYSIEASSPGGDWSTEVSKGEIWGPS